MNFKGKDCLAPHLLQVEAVGHLKPAPRRPAAEPRLVAPATLGGRARVHACLLDCRHAGMQVAGTPRGTEQGRRGKGARLTCGMRARASSTINGTLSMPTA